MGGWFLERMKSIAVFMLCVQCLLHFSPGDRYGKYIKLLAGIMVLAQILIPLQGLFPEAERIDMENEIESFRQELDQAMEEIPDRFLTEGEDGAEGGELFVTSVEEELRQRLEETAAAYGCRVERVELTLPNEEAGGRPDGQTLIVTVSPQGGGGDAASAIEPVRVEEIQVGEADREESGQGADEIAGPLKRKLREAFSEELGMEEGGIEVNF